MDNTIDNEYVSALAVRLPGFLNRTKYPCECRRRPEPLGWVIGHLNDVDKWSREEIADWLDELHDTGQVNIEFKVDTGEA